MTTTKWYRDLLKDEWDDLAEASDRTRPVPQPTIVQEGQVKKRSVYTGDDDVIIVQDGDFPIVEPQSIGYREERVEIILDAEIVTSKSRERLLGTREETYGGLAGETKRISDKYRTGYPPNAGELTSPGYDILTFETFDQQIGDRGADLWAGTWTVRFITFASQISQDAYEA